MVEEVVQKGTIAGNEKGRFIKISQLKSILNFSQIDPNFYEIPAFSDPKWKNVNFKDRILFTHYACHGFHFKLCKRRVYHTEA
jgi:hypothetical protein